MPLLPTDGKAFNLRGIAYLMRHLADPADGFTQAAILRAQFEEFAAPGVILIIEFALDQDAEQLPGLLVVHA